MLFAATSVYRCLVDRKHGLELNEELNLNTKDKRKSKRFPIRQLVDISPTKENFLKATGLNLSETGILCKLESEEVDNYANVFLMLDIPGSEDSLQVEGIVVRIEKQKADTLIAIEFSNLDDAEKKIISKIIKNF